MTDAINDGKVPEAYLEDLSGLANEIEAQIPECVEPAPPAEEDDDDDEDDRGKGKGKKKGKDKDDAEDNDDSGGEEIPTVVEIPEIPTETAGITTTGTTTAPEGE